MSKTIRWKQRFQNLEKGFAQLQKGLAIAKPSEIEQQGIIQSFEFTFELAWKTLKDYLESQKVNAPFPREVIKESFKYHLIADGDVWMDILDKRNTLAHTYDEAAAQEAVTLISETYAPALEKVVALLNRKT